MRRVLDKARSLPIRSDPLAAILGSVWQHAQGLKRLELEESAMCG